MQTKPFVVLHPVAGQTSPKLMFTVHAYTLDQAKAIVAARVVGKTIIVDPAAFDGASQ